MRCFYWKKRAAREVGFEMEREWLIVKYHHVLRDMNMMESLKVFVKRHKTHSSNRNPQREIKTTISNLLLLFLSSQF